MTTSRLSAVRPWHPAIAAFLMATGLLLVLASTPLQVAGQAPLLSSEEQALLEDVNDYRIQNGLNPLTISPALTEAARWMSQDMGDGDYFSHSDSLNRSPFDRMAASGYDCEAYNTWCGENLAAGVSAGSETFELWRNSPGHNGNMLNPNYVVAGIAAAFNQDSTYGWYWTLDMGGFDDSGQAPPTATPEADADRLPSRRRLPPQRRRSLRSRLHRNLWPRRRLYRSLLLRQCRRPLRRRHRPLRRRHRRPPARPRLR